MSRIGAIDWDETINHFQYKLGYCACGKKILATPDEVREIANTFEGFRTKIPLRRRIALRLAKRLINEISTERS